MRILIVDDQALIRKSIQAVIQSAPGGEGHSIFMAGSKEEALELLETQIIDLAFLDLNLGDDSKPEGIELLRELRVSQPNTVPIIVTGHEETAIIEECLKLGAADYLIKPFNEELLRQVLRKAPVVHRLLRKNETYKSRVETAKPSRFHLQSKSPAYLKVLEQAKKFRGTDHSLLIRGESGSGKEVLAQFLWDQENDDSRPMIPVNCGAITPTLAESEFFGHKKGSFTGATEHRTGKFESADGGDLFLDELATLGMEIQVKLLRALGTGEIFPVGQDKPKKVKCRVIAATNENLEEMIKAKTFREDLLFRIKQFTLTLPPLRERKDDILDLANYFLKEKNYLDKSFSKNAEAFLLSYSWPGNIRELKSAVEVAAVLSDGAQIQVSDLKPHLIQSSTETAAPQLQTLSSQLEDHEIEGNFQHLVRGFERKLIERALEKSGSESAAAKFLGIPRSTLGDIRKRLKLATP